MRGYGGRRAAQPSPDWAPPEVIVAGGTAVRFIEEIDFDYAAPDATAVLFTAAA